MKSINPFADVGTTISGVRFIGREDELYQIGNRLFGAGGFGSVALVGIPRIGKTSLVAEAIRRAQPKLKKLKAVIVNQDLGSYSSVEMLFRALIGDLVEKLRENGWLNEAIEGCATRVIDEPIMSFNAIRDVFGQIRRLGVRPICIFDEFDAGRYLLSGAPHCFHWLRELASVPEYKAALVLISKRRMQDVARIAGHASDYWANVYMSLTLRQFTLEELDLFFDKLASTGVRSDDETKKEILSLSGRHPYLLDSCAFRMWQRMSHGLSQGVEWLRDTMRPVVRDYYQQVSSILCDTKGGDSTMLSKLIQVVVGPQWNIGRDGIDAMIEYGILSGENEKRLKTFSDGFDEYLSFIETTVDIWPLWRDSEKSLRDAMEILLIESLGANWPKELTVARPKIGSLIADCEEKMGRERARFGQRAAPSILAYAYPMDLFQVMAVDWPTFGEPLFGTDKQGWSSKFGVLAKVRTPLAHNRDDAVSEGERRQAEGVCKEILARIKQWQGHRGSNAKS